ncbi:hypothetical protein JCM5353_001770 [Sporobolomyces roseus]
MSQPYHQERRQPFGRLAWTPEETQLLHQLLETYGPDYRLFIQLHGQEGTESTLFKYKHTSGLRDKTVHIKKTLIRAGKPIPKGFENVKVSISRPSLTRETIRWELIGR